MVIPKRSGAGDGRGAADLARWVIEDLLGWELDVDKAVKDAEGFVALGVQVGMDTPSSCLRFEVPADKIQKWTEEITSVLRSGFLMPSAARKLAGRLSWGSSMVFGKGARVYLAPLYYHAGRKASCISYRLRASLSWWLRFLQNVPVRLLPILPVPRDVLTLYTDASGDGHLAWVASCGDLMEWSSIVVPARLQRWVRHRKTQIATWELIAALCALWRFLQHSRLCVGQGVQINLFVDSNVALGTLLRGSSRQQDWNDLVQDLWFQVARTGTLLFAWRVPSKQNIADIPTRPAARRQELQRLRACGFEEVPWQWPEAAPWL